MKLFKTMFIIIIIIALHSALFANATGSGDFLKIPYGARYSALGETFVALADDATTVTINPAGLGTLHYGEIHLQNLLWFEGLTGQYVSAAQPFDFGTVGISLVYFHATVFNAYDRYDGTITESPKYNNMYINGAVGRQIVDSDNLNIFAGGGIRYISQTYDDTSIPDITFDGGVIFNFEKVLRQRTVNGYIFPNGISLGASVTTLELTGGEEYENVPMGWRVGLAAPVINALSFGTEVRSYSGESPQISIGIEGSITPMFQLRAGYKINSPSEKITTGIGFRFGIASVTGIIDYALALQPNLHSSSFGGFGNTHTISIGIKFQDFSAQRRSERLYYSGVAVYVEGDIEQAIKYWEEAVEVYPANRKAVDRLKEVKYDKEVQRMRNKLSDVEQRFDEIEQELEQQDARSESTRNDNEQPLYDDEK